MSEEKRQELLDITARIGLIPRYPERVTRGIASRIADHQDIEEMTIGEILALRLETINGMEDLLS